MIVLFVLFATGKESGIELSRSDAITYRLREGKITEIAYYNNQQQPRQAVGLAG